MSLLNSKHLSHAKNNPTQCIAHWLKHSLENCGEEDEKDH